MPSTRISRKEFLGMSALAGAGMMMAGRIPAASATPLSLEPYAVPLPIPKVAVETDSGVINISAKQFPQALHPNLPEVTVWGYSDGAFTHYPGPTIEVHKNRSTTVHFKNELPGPHPYIPIATQAPDGSDFPGIKERGPGPRILTHLHGGFVTGTNDGNPYATQTEYTTGQTQTVTYPAHPRATTLWYHDHALGMTRLNVYAGLAGFVRMRDDSDTGKEPNPLGIPGGPYEVPIALQDKSFTADGQLFYSPDESWIPEFFGDTPVVNGAVQPFLEVEPRMYRLTFLNGSQARFYHLQLDNGRPFYQIGSEGGMFNKPVSVNSILLLPAERADVIVDFSGLGGKDIVLNNLQLPAGVSSPATPDLPNLMQFQVRGTPTTPGPQSIPKTLAGGSLANVGGPIAKKRNITLEEQLDADGNPIRLVINGRRFEETVDEAPRAGTVEEWRFVNISADTHPIHMHLTNFQVMGRAPLDGPGYAAALAAARDKKPGAPPLLPNNTIDPTPFLLGPEVPPPRNEKGWKDTVGAHPDQVTRIRQRFDLPAGASLPQKYVYHCHILEHEDNDMMRPFEVVQ